MNKGNHELPEMNAFYGFRKEVANDTLWVKFNEIFQLLPIAHVINNSVFVVHGGLPKEPIKIGDSISEHHEFLWNDPTDKNGVHESPRGDGVFRFGPDITERFLKLNNFRTLIRSHEMVDDGFEWSQNGKCLTVFSAPYYAGHYKNLGGYVVIHSSGVIECKQFESSKASRL